MAKSGWIFETSSQMTGVPLDELYCPTCGFKIVDFNLHSEPEDFDYTIPFVPSRELIGIKPGYAYWYLLCPNDHKWSVKTLWRAPGQPDRVQLDRFLGGP